MKLKGVVRHFTFVLMMVWLVACASLNITWDTFKKKEAPPPPPPVEKEDFTRGESPFESDSDANPAGRAPASESPAFPWEVESENGDSILPDLFYAEDSQNQQVMPLTIDGRYEINRLLYPTLGHPALVVKSDPQSNLMFVVRVEEEFLSHLQPESRPLTSQPALSAMKTARGEIMTFKEDSANQMGFYLIRRNRRSLTYSNGPTRDGDGRDVIKLKPSFILADKTTGDMPRDFTRRRTLKVYFNNADLQQVPGGLFDVRFEILKDGQLVSGTGDMGIETLFEGHYNSVRVFDEPGFDYEHYTFINVTDAQIASSGKFVEKTVPKLKDFVKFVNSSADPSVRGAAFITFNGDLHNGGSPDVLFSREVANEYQSEAKAVLNILKDLDFPIFLTPGNHDGYVATGHTPKLLSGAGRVASKISSALASRVDELTLATAVTLAKPKAWPNFTWSEYQNYLHATEFSPGGRHLDIFEGQFVRRGGSRWNTWLKVSDSDRNMILYDGFYQWRRTYGPLYYSWTFGKNHFVSLNSYDLRQHRRSGWGMYTVNYGGGLSQVQNDWFKRDVHRSEAKGYDITMIAHHDPRGGHTGLDYPYYYTQAEYTGIEFPAWSYVYQLKFGGTVCGSDWLKSRKQSIELDCMHDGLQEWMLADKEFDCDDDLRQPDGRCDLRAYSPQPDPKKNRHPWYSGYALVDHLTRVDAGSQNSRLRTLLLGHTHSNTLEIFHDGDELIPDHVILDKESNKRYRALEHQNPLRRIEGDGNDPFNPKELETKGLEDRGNKLYLNLAKSSHNLERTLRGDRRELVIIRSTSVADLTGQKFQGKNMYGFSVFGVYPRADSREYRLPQVNEISYFIDTEDHRHGNEGIYKKVGGKPYFIDRTLPVRVYDSGNPAHYLFQ